MRLKQKWWLPLFSIMLIAQIAVPAYMVYEEESVINTGTEYRFETAALDPADPFRGRYLTLSFAENNIEIDSTEEWRRGETIYVGIKNNNKGFVQAISVHKTPPRDKEYVKAKVTRFHRNLPRKVSWEYGFNRYYMQEFQSLKAETIYRNATRDTNSVTYAKVMVKHGKSTLTDVIVNDTSIVSLSRIVE